MIASKKVLWVVLPLVVAVVATMAKAFVNHENWSRGYSDNPSRSVADARRRGILVTEWTAVPNELPGFYGRFRFGEIWVEERILSSHLCVWFPYEKRLAGHVFCFTLSGGEWRKFQFIRGEHDRGNWEHNTSTPDSSTSISDRDADEFGVPIYPVYKVEIDSPDVSQMHIGFVRASGTPLTEAARLIPKK